MNLLSVPMTGSSDAVRVEDRYFEVFDLLTAALAALAPSHARAVTAYLRDAREEGAGESLDDELVFTFPTPGGMQAVTSAACQHWFEQLLFGLREPLGGITAESGYALRPREPNRSVQFAVLDGTVVSLGADGVETDHGTPAPSNAPARGDECPCEVCRKLRAGERPPIEHAADSDRPTDGTFERLSDALNAPEAVETLEVPDQGLRELPGIERMVNLEWIFAFDNNLTDLPPALFALPRLQGINVSSNQLASLSPEIGAARALTMLDVSGNQLSALPESLGDLATLERLSARDNRIERLPDGFLRLSALRELDLNGNPLAAIPALGQLRRLEKLDLGSVRRPDAFADLDLSMLDHLQELGIWWNDLERLPRLPPTLRVLSAGGNRLTSVPVEIRGQVERLQLTSNQLTEIPDLPRIKDLRVDGNPQLRSLGALPGVEWLEVQNTALQSLPVGMLALKTLIIAGTGVRRLPDGLESLRRLVMNREQIDDVALDSFDELQIDIW